MMPYLIERAKKIATIEKSKREAKLEESRKQQEFLKLRGKIAV